MPLKPRIVLVYVGMSTLNPTIPSLIKDLQSLGVVCIDVLSTDTSLFAALSDGAALVLFDENVLACRDSPKGIRNFMVFDSPLKPARVNDMLSVAVESGAALGLFADKYDLHRELGGGLTNDELAWFSILIWPYTTEPVSRSDVVQTPYAEPFMTETHDPLQYWQRLNELIPIQVEFTHIIEPDEIRKRPRHAMWDTSIPGALYATRRIAYESARSRSLSVAPLARTDFLLRGVTSTLAQGSLSPPIQRFRFVLRRANLSAHVRASHCAFVCGGGYEYFVRKYFEIPALGVPMVGFPLAALERYGFLPEVHYIAAFPEDFGEAAERVLQDPSLGERIARQASELVATLHTPEHRLPRFIKVLEDVLSGRASGGSFKHGDLTSH